MTIDTELPPILPDCGKSVKGIQPHLRDIGLLYYRERIPGDNGAGDNGEWRRHSP